MPCTAASHFHTSRRRRGRRATRDVLKAPRSTSRRSRGLETRSHRVMAERTRKRPSNTARTRHAHSPHMSAPRHKTDITSDTRTHAPDTLTRYRLCRGLRGEHRHRASHTTVSRLTRSLRPPALAALLSNAAGVHEATNRTPSAPRGQRVVLVPVPVTWL